PDFAATPAPDGRSIAFLGYDDELKSYQQNHLYVMGPDGSGVRELLSGFPGSPGQIEWAPDGKSLFMLFEDHGVLTLNELDLQGRLTQVVTGIGG
ncbi:MAG TPA: S9 family peptidase, partial [Hyphomonas sp.]|nr:S9 family peptidase [Hyphomonas sp.]